MLKASARLGAVAALTLLSLAACTINEAPPAQPVVATAPVAAAPAPVVVQPATPAPPASVVVTPQ